MKKINYLFVLLLAVTSLVSVSCDKDDDDDDDVTPTPKTCYVQTETTEDGITKYEYNASNQLIKITDYDLNNIPIGTYKEFTYTNGKPTKMEDFDNGTVTTKVEVTYDNLGKQYQADLYLDTMGTGTLTKLGYYRFTYSGDLLSAYSLYVSVFGQNIELSRTLLTYNGSNVSTVANYMMGASLQLELESTQEYVYDSKKNPRRGVGVDYFMGLIELCSANNPTKSTHKDADGIINQSQSFNFTYEYNTDNYPTKGIETAVDNSYTSTRTVTYTCK